MKKLSGYSTNLIVVGLPRISPFLLLPVLIHEVGFVELGRLALVEVAISILGVLCVFSYDQLITIDYQNKDLDRVIIRSDGSVFTISAWIAISGSVVAVVSLFDVPKLFGFSGTELAIILGMLLSSRCKQLTISHYRAADEYRPLFTLSLLNAISFLVLGFVFIKSDLALLGYLLASFSSEIPYLYLVLFRSIKYKKIRGLFCRLKKNSARCTKLTANGLVSVSADLIERSIISTALGLSALGEYNLVSKIASVIVSVHEAIKSTYYPAVFGAIHKRGELSDAGDIYVSNYRIFTLLSAIFIFPAMMYLAYVDSVHLYLSMAMALSSVYVGLAASYSNVFLIYAERFSPLMASNLIRVLGMLGFMYLALYFGAGMEGVLAAKVVSSAASTIYLFASAMTVNSHLRMRDTISVTSLFFLAILLTQIVI
jgi:O-antigen/teichoic acid export membrane protein